MRGKRDIERELIHAEAKGEALQTLLDSALADRVELQSQVTKLQDALVAAKAPEAYRDQQIEREDQTQVPVSADRIEKNRIIQDTTEAYMNSLEKPLFQSADDLDALLARSLMRDRKGPASLHGNDES